MTLWKALLVGNQNVTARRSQPGRVNALKMDDQISHFSPSQAVQEGPLSPVEQRGLNPDGCEPLAQDAGVPGQAVLVVAADDGDFTDRHASSTTGYHPGWQQHAEPTVFSNADAARTSGRDTPARTTR